MEETALKIKLTVGNEICGSYQIIEGSSEDILNKINRAITNNYAHFVNDDSFKRIIIEKI